MDADIPSLRLCNDERTLATAELQREQITQANQRNSPLLRLPPELRSRIYNLVFADTSVDIRKVNKIDYYCSLYQIPSTSYEPIVGILRTCRQLHHEALPIYYDLCTFIISPGIGDIQPQPAWEKCRLVMVGRVPFITWVSGFLGNLVREAYRRRMTAVFPRACAASGEKVEDELVG